MFANGQPWQIRERHSGEKYLNWIHNMHFPPYGGFKTISQVCNSNPQERDLYRLVSLYWNPAAHQPLNIYMILA